VVCRATTPCCAQSYQSRGFSGETFVGVSRTAPVVRAVIDDYLKRSESISASSRDGNVAGLFYRASYERVSVSLSGRKRSISEHGVFV